MEQGDGSGVETTVQAGDRTQFGGGEVGEDGEEDLTTLIRNRRCSLSRRKGKEHTSFGNESIVGGANMARGMSKEDRADWGANEDSSCSELLVDDA